MVKELVINFFSLAKLVTETQMSWQVFLTDTIKVLSELVYQKTGSHISHEQDCSLLLTTL